MPQHTDHAGVMWHGAYVAWLEEARVEALAHAGLPYEALSRTGVELPVVGLQLDYRHPLRLGDRARLLSRLESRRGPRLRWLTHVLAPGEVLAVVARVELVALSAVGAQRRVLRRLPAALEAALGTLEIGPDP
jgi:acyl-CoA thioester hydrolase